MTTARLHPPRSVHLVGSIGLDTVENVFNVVGKKLGPYLKRIPDGEIGGRRIWISWQYPLLRANPYLAPDPSGAVRPTNKFPLLTLAPGVKPDDVHFGELNYSREARASYLDFVEARDRGIIPKGVRFQVCLPTPFAVVSSVTVRDALLAVESAYEAAMIREVERICHYIPHEDLCIQWDLCNEMVIWDGQQSGGVPYPDEPKQALLDRTKRMCEVIPDGVELGLHLCYGDFGGTHFVEPKDASAMVDFANALVKSIGRKITYIHMPVPLGRDDEAFHAPFDKLDLTDGTEVYLGIVHVQDGVEGFRQRLETAQRHLRDFGIATECGMARARTEDTVHKLLDIHAALCE